MLDVHGQARRIDAITPGHSYNEKYLGVTFLSTASSNLKLAWKAQKVVRNCFNKINNVFGKLEWIVLSAVTDINEINFSF